MRLTMLPDRGPRYWSAIMIASICGANAGDLLPEVLGLTATQSFIALAVLFVGAVAAGHMVLSEIPYWLALVIVRAAATEIGDGVAGSAHQGYRLIASIAAAILLGLYLLDRPASRQAADGGHSTDIVYWLMMVTAGTLGTVIGDGLGHAAPSVLIGVPLSAAVATLALAGVLASIRYGWKTSAAYWTGVVTVRWWGTSVGDISAYLTTIPISMVLSAVGLVALLMLWRPDHNIGAAIEQRRPV